MATPMESVRKSWSKTRRGLHSQRRPGLRKLPTSSRFLVSTLMMGRWRRWKRLRSSARFELEIAIRTGVGGDLLVIDTQGIAHLIEEATVLGQTAMPSWQSSSEILV